ncbi:ribonuclease H-like domain-containing protein [Tanacetum coccineum]
MADSNDCYTNEEVNKKKAERVLDLMETNLLISPHQNKRIKLYLKVDAQGHTVNKDHLELLKECKWSLLTYGELGHFNLFSILQICDKQHKVLFTETKCLIVSPDFKMPDENQILLKVPRQHNMYSFDMKTHAPAKDYTCLIAKAISDESKLWHKRFSWVFLLATKDETSGILQNFIREIKNQLNHIVKIIRADNVTEFKNWNMLEFYGNKGIKQEYSNARTPQQNGVVERINRTLIEAVRTMLAGSLLPTTFWAEAVSTACYIFNRLQNLKTQEKEAYSTSISEDTLEILAFRRELDELAPKHLSEVPKNKATNTTSVNSGSGHVNTQHADQDDSDMPELTIFNKPWKGIFDEASYDDEGMVHDFNNLPTEVAEEPKKISEALKDDSWVEAMQEELLQFRLQQKVLVYEFEELMKGRFQMSSMGELIFFLGLQVKQKTDGFFFSQDKYVADMLKKFSLTSVKTAITPMETKMALTKDKEADEVDIYLYRSMIGSFMYLTTSRPDKMIYNFSKLIVDGMVANMKDKTNSDVPLDFLQMILEIQTENKYPYLAIVLTKKIFRKMKRGFRGVPRPLLPAMLPVVVVDQSAGQTDQAVDQPLPSEPLPSSSHLLVISATTESEPTPVAEPTPHPKSPSHEPNSEPIEHTFEPPSPEHQQLSPRQETGVPQSQDPTHPHVAEKRTITCEIGEKDKKMEDVLKMRHVVLPNSADEDAEISSKQGRNLQEEGLDEMVRNMMKDKSEGFKTPTQSKTFGEEDISPTTLEAAKTLSKVASTEVKSVIRVKDTRGENKKASLAESHKIANLLEEEETYSNNFYLDHSLPKKGKKTELTKQPKQKRKAQFHFEQLNTTNNTAEDWDSIRAKLEALSELKKNV